MDQLDIVIDRLHTDAAFRKGFQRNPDAALAAAGLSLSDEERDAILETGGGSPIKDCHGIC